MPPFDEQTEQSLPDLVKQTRDAIAKAVPTQAPAPEPDDLNTMVSGLQETFASWATEKEKEKTAARAQRMTQPITPTDSADLIRSQALGTAAGLIKGLLSPVSAFLPETFADKLDLWQEDSVRKTLGMMQKSRFAATYDATPATKQFLAGAPSTIGEFAGSLPAFIGTYGAARSAFAVPKAASFSAQLTRSLLAGAATGGVLSAAAKLDPGESRWARVAEQSVAMGAFEMIGIPAMMKAWQEETPNITAAVATQLGQHQVAAAVSKPSTVAFSTVAEVKDALSTMTDAEKAQFAADLAAGITAKGKTAVIWQHTEDPTRVGALVEGKKLPPKAKVIGTFSPPPPEGAPPTGVPPTTTTTTAPLTDAEIAVQQMGTPEGRAAAARVATQAGRDVEKIQRERKVSWEEAKRIYRDQQAIESQLTAIRAGVPAKPEVVQAVLKAGTADSKLEQTPIVLQAAKQADAQAALNEPQITIDPLIASEAKNHVGRVTVTWQSPTGEAGGGSTDFTYDPTNPTHLKEQVTRFKQQLWQMTQDGTKVKVAGITSADADGANTLLTALQGKAKPPAPLAVEQRKVPGAAPPATVAENGDVPAVGDLIRVAEPDKPVVQGTVVQGVQIVPPKSGRELHIEDLVARGHTPEEAEQLTAILERQGFVFKGAPVVELPAVEPPKNTLTVERPDGTRSEVPLAYVQVPMSIGRSTQNVRLKPHLDGSDRRAIVHVDTGEISFEPRGGSNLPEQNHFRGELFGSTDPDVQFGLDPRMFIRRDGSVVLSVPPLSGQAELSTQRRAAQVLLRKGISGDTSVLVAVAGDSHVPMQNVQSTQKLRDLASMSLPLANLTELQDAASERGLKAIPFGTKIALQSPRGYSRDFADSLEAMEAVQRIPHAEGTGKVEKDLELAWKMGSMRAWDPDVDVNRFLPTSMHEQAIGELVQGRKNLVPVYTKDEGALRGTVAELERQMGVPADTLKVLALPDMDNMGRKAFVLYNKDAVTLSAAKNRDALRFLGVEQRDVDQILQALSRKGKGNGIYVLSGRPAEDAALYTYWRDAGAKELWEQGRIEQDSLGPYRRYTKEAKQRINYPGAGDEPYLNADLGDFVKAPDVSFKPDSGSHMPIIEPEPDFAATPPRWDPEHLPAETPFADISGPLAKVTMRFRPMMELSKDLQNRLGAPFYDWWRAINVAAQKVQQVTVPALRHINELALPLGRDARKQVQLLFEARMLGLGDVAAYEKKFGPSVVEAAGKLEKFYNEFFSSEGFSQPEVKTFFSMFPNIRKADGDFRYAARGRSVIPTLGRLFSKDLENGNIPITDREFDFQKIANRLIRGLAEERHLNPTWEKMKTEAEAWVEARRIPADVLDLYVTHLNEVIHMPDALQMSLARATRQVFKSMKLDVSDTDAQDFVSMMTQMNYFTNLAWKVGVPLRNLLQTMQTSLPIVGAKDWLEGWRYGTAWWKDKAIQEEMVKRGVVRPGTVYAPLQELTGIIERGTEASASPLQQKVGKAADLFFNRGTRWHANTDDFNRVVAYRAQYLRAKRFGEQYISGKIDWPTFLEKSKADMRDVPNGGFITELKKLMEPKTADAVERVASRLGDEFQKATQYVYERGNAPYAMQSTLGRFLFQYGTWPAWYAENLRNMLVRGSRSNRIAAVGRWVGVQSAMFGAANAAFGVDATRWLFFSPLGYTGGPFAQMGLQAASTWNAMVDPSQNDPIARIQRGRLLNSIIKQTVPLPIGAATDTLRAIREWESGNVMEGMRRMAGLPSAKQPLTSWTR